MNHHRQGNRKGRHLLPALLAAASMTVCIPDAFCPGCAAAAQDLPKAEIILERFVEATGGRAAHEKIHNRTAKGTVEIAGTGLAGSIVSRAAAPNFEHSIIELPGAGLMEQGTDGEVAWESSTVQGPRILSGDERATALREARFHAPLQWRELYSKAEVVGTEEVEGRPCYKVILTPAQGKPVTHYYDREDGLLRKVSMVVSNPMGEIAVEAFPGDYKEVDGLLVPFSLKQKVLSQELLIRLDTVELNVTMPEGAFDLPADVKPLVEKAKGGEDPAKAAEPRRPPPDSDRREAA